MDDNSALTYFYNEYNKILEDKYQNERFLYYSSLEYRDEIYNDISSQLNNLVGLNDVKDEVFKLINYLFFIKKIGNNVTLDRVNLNMIFRGNPGTGKTTVARIISNVLYKMGILSSNKFIEVTPKDFVAGYVGQTAIKASKLIEEYRGGVIFIDEAYTFVSGKGKNGSSFSGDAITEILKEMETNNTVFIFAGYNIEMNKFLDLNPGLRSRIGYNFNFSDYSVSELYEILENKFINSGFKISDDAKILLIKLIENRRCEKNFGNGRMINNLFNELLREHATIMASVTDINKLVTITCDVVSKLFV